MENKEYTLRYSAFEPMLHIKKPLYIRDIVIDDKLKKWVLSCQVV
jgi:hypothetical protein